MDPFTIKPIDKAGILKHAGECHGKILVVEDHYSEGGIGDAVLDAVAETRNILVKKMCVREVPRSGPPMVLLENMESELNALSKQFKNSRRLPNLIYHFNTVHNETGYNETIAFICGFYIPSLIQRIFNTIKFRLNKTTAIFANQMHKNFI